MSEIVKMTWNLRQRSIIITTTTHHVNQTNK